jgi:hypothetical protein
MGTFRQDPEIFVIECGSRASVTETDLVVSVTLARDPHSITKISGSCLNVPMLAPRLTQFLSSLLKDVGVVRVASLRSGRERDQALLRLEVVLRELRAALIFPLLNLAQN